MAMYLAPDPDPVFVLSKTLPEYIGYASSRVCLQQGVDPNPNPTSVVETRRPLEVLVINSLSLCSLGNYMKFCNNLQLESQQSWVMDQTVPTI